MRWKQLGLMVVLVTSVSSIRAFAQAPPAPSEAERLIDEGVELRRSGNERDALERFRKAHELEPSARALGQMGLAEKSLRLWPEAEQHLKGALAATSDPWVEKNRATLEQALGVVTNNIALLRETNVEDAERKPEAAVAPAPQTPAPPTPPPAPPEPVTDSDGSTQRTLAYVGAGVGVVGIGVGTFFGLRALSLKRERDELCPDVECDNPQGVETDQRARDAALVSTIGFGVGIIALGAAAVLWLSAPSQTSRTPAVAFGAGRRQLDLKLRF